MRSDDFAGEKKGNISWEASYLLQQIAEPRVRNLVRGALTARTDDAFVKTMSSLHRETTAADATVVGNILQTSVLAKFAEPAASFPDTATTHTDTPFYNAERLDLELAIQHHRLVDDQSRIVSAIKLVSETNDALLNFRIQDVETLLRQFKADFGVSTTMALKAISLRNTLRFADLGTIDLAPTLDTFRRPRRALVTSAFEDTSSHERDFIKLRRFYIGVANSGRVSPADAVIVRDLLSPFNADGADFANRIQAFGRGHVFDLIAFLYRLAELLTRLGQEAEALAVNSAIPPTIARAWNDAFADRDVTSVQDFVGYKDQFSDLVYFAHLPAWSEYPAFYRQRLDVEVMIGRRLDGNLAKPFRREPLIALNPSAKDIAEQPVEAAPGEKWRAPDGGFARTIAFVASVEHGVLQEPDGRDLLRVLDRTLNVPILLSVDEIESFLPRHPEDPLYEYLRAALLNDAEGGALRDHALRRTVERLLKEQFEGDILKLAAFVDSKDGHVSKHLFQMCSETFLSNLYGLYRLADDVMEAQTSLLEWEGNRRDDHDATLRAKSLRLLIRLRKVRGSIEETRIYVDPLRLLEWLHENLEVEIRALQPLASEIVESQEIEYNSADTVTNTVQPRARLLDVLDRGYQEFAGNKVHGAASYIGRRVRHGKFNGHLAVEMRETIYSAAEEFATSSPPFANFLRRWYRDLDEATHNFARERIHVRSKARPRGLIVATIQDPDKHAVVRFAVNGLAEAMWLGAPATQIIAVLLDYCWLLIEVDLKRARTAIEDLRRQFVIDADQHLTGSAEIDNRIVEHVRSLNAELTQRFEAAKSWLTRRSNASPSASVSLMVEAVIDEVKQRFAFKPIIDLPEDLDLDLIGHTFHFFYDTLWILVTNAAEYGYYDGSLRVEVSSITEPDEENVDLFVTVTSQFKQATEEKDKAAIDAVMCADIGDAMERDGGTGLRKLRSLVAEAKDIVGFEHAFDGDHVSFTLHSRYPLS